MTNLKKNEVKNSVGSTNYNDSLFILYFLLIAKIINSVGSGTRGEWYTGTGPVYHFSLYNNEPVFQDSPSRTSKAGSYSINICFITMVVQGTRPLVPPPCITTPVSL